MRNLLRPQPFDSAQDEGELTEETEAEIMFCYFVTSICIS